MNPKVWQASGHLTAGFADNLVECKNCHKRFLLDEIANPKLETLNPKPRRRTSSLQGRQIQNSIRQLADKNQKNKCPECKGELTEARKFNLMMKTHIGPVKNSAALSYLRAETCQGIYVNFQNVLQTMRLKIPFGIAQIGKAFRNEITPGDFIFRTREFEQMELQWFCNPKEAAKYFEYWEKERIKWYLNLGIKKENLRAVEVPESKRAHYAAKQVDIEYRFPFGWREIEGIHNRSDWDLSNHSKHSCKDLGYFDDSPIGGLPAGGKKRYFPYIIETSVGAERLLFAFLVDSFQEVKGGREKVKNQKSKVKSKHEVEILLKLHPKIAPVKVAVLPLVRNKPELVKKAKEVYQLLKPYFFCQYDESGTIGKRYRRQDEIGTLYAITVDFETFKSADITLRWRDTMKQERVKIKDLIKVLREKLEN